MAWIFTNTITSLPRYYLKVEIIADCGTTGTLNATNGGYIASLGALTQEIDEDTGRFKPGDISIELRNVGDVFSTNVFTSILGQIELRIWISYDTGTSYTNVFFGFINNKSFTYRDKHATITTGRIYPCNAYSALLSLKDVAVDFTTYPISTGNVTVATPLYYTDDVGTPVYFDTKNIEYCQLREVLNQICQRMTFIAGATAPTIAINTTAVQAAAKNGATEVTFDDIYLHYTNSETSIQSYGYLGSHFMDFTGRVSAYDAINYQELLNRWCDWLLVYPRAVMTESGGAYTVTVSFLPRWGYSSAVAGTLSPLMARAFETGLWFDGPQAETPGLIVKFSAAGGSRSRPLEMRNWFATSPDFGATHYMFLGTIIISGAEKTNNKNITAQQLFIKTGASSMVNVFQFKHLTAQSFLSATADYYGVQRSIYELALEYAPALRSAYFVRGGFEWEFATLKSSTSLADVALMKTYTVGSVAYQITSITRDFGKNRMIIKGVQLA